MAVPGVTNGIDQEQLDAELARINVLRLRGQYEEAKGLGTRVLTAAPTSADALSLMGDIASELGELESAERYYRLSLDYNPGSPSETRKLTGIRKRIDDQRAAEVAKRIGLSSGGPQVAIFVATTLLFVAALGVLGYALGTRARSATPPTAITTPIDVAKPAPPPAPSVKTASTPPVETPVVESTTAVAEDSLIEKAIQDRTKHGGLLAGAVSDPRDRSATLTFSVDAPFTKDQLATFAVDALESMPEVRRVVVRTVIKAEFAMIGEMKRESFDKVKSGEVQPADALENFWERTQAGT